VSPSFASCELTYLTRSPIDVRLASAQHAEYERALEACGWEVRRLPSDPGMPDAVFIEDTAVALDEIAIITRPGAVSRLAEVDAVAAALEGLRPVSPVAPPGTMDGGDVLVAGRSIFIGCSTRTNLDAIEQVRQMVTPHGYRVTAVAVAGCLHLKSAATAVSDDTLLINPQWVPEELRRLHCIELHPDEPHAANVVRMDDRNLLAAAAYPRTREILQKRGFTVVSIDVSELAKAEGAVTCCSLLIR
jgi:dimethylargininase